MLKLDFADHVLDGMLGQFYVKRFEHARNIVNSADNWAEFTVLNPRNGFNYSQMISCSAIFWDYQGGRCVMFLIAQQNMVK